MKLKRISRSELRKILLSSMHWAELRSNLEGKSTRPGEFIEELSYLSSLSDFELARLRP